MKSQTEISHRGPYTIRAMRIGSSFGAQVFRGKGLLGPRHVGEDAPSAIAKANAWLDVRKATELKVRAETGVPSVEAYREAFELVGLNRSERAMLDAHMVAPWSTLTATELARAAGWDNWSAANLHYGGLGRKIAEAIDWTPPTRLDGSAIWTMAIATPSSLDDVPPEEALDFLMSGVEKGGEFEWSLRPQVIDALQAHYIQ